MSAKTVFEVSAVANVLVGVHGVSRRRCFDPYAVRGHAGWEIRVWKAL